MPDTVVWRIIDGNLPFLYDFPTQYAIEYTSDVLWQISDGTLPYKNAFPHLHGFSDVPDSMWAIHDGALPYKKTFPQMYPIEKPAAAPKPPYFTFKGVDSTEFGIMEMDPLCIKHEQKTDFLYMPTQGVSVMQTRTYKSKVITVTLGLTDISPENILRLNQWLIGQGPLTFSRDPKRYYMASCNGAITGQRLLSLGKIPVQFNVMPFKYNINDEYQKATVTATTLTHNATVEYEGTVNGLPKLKIYVDDPGDIWIRCYNTETGYTSDNIEITGVTDFVVIDVQARKVYDENNNVILNRTFGDITTLQLLPGENNFVMTTNINDLRVKHNTRWY